jgi:hypothetical protein
MPARCGETQRCRLPLGRFVPAAGRAWLTRTCARTVAVTVCEHAWRRSLPATGLVGGAVFEVGRATGSLTPAPAAVDVAGHSA